MVADSGCQVCGMLAGPPNTFHPHLFCVLFKAGITNPRNYLEMAGWSYTPSHSRIPRTVQEASSFDESAP